MFVTIDTDTDSNTGNIAGGATNIDVWNYGGTEATITISGQAVPIPPGSGWSSGHSNTGFGPIAYSASADSRLVIIAWN